MFPFIFECLMFFFIILYHVYDSDSGCIFSREECDIINFLAAIIDACFLYCMFPFSLECLVYFFIILYYVQDFIICKG